MKEEKESKLPSDKELTQVLKDSATSFEEQDIGHLFTRNLLIMTLQKNF